MTERTAEQERAAIVAVTQDDWEQVAANTSTPLGGHILHALLGYKRLAAGLSTDEQVEAEGVLYALTMLVAHLHKDQQS